MTRESIEAAARAYADSMGHGDACDRTLYGEEYRCDCGYSALRSALAQPAAPEAGSAGAMREACAIETDRILASWGYADDPDSVRAQVGARIRALPLPAPEATGAGENPWCYVVVDADMRGWDGEYYKVKGAADGEAMVANKQVEVPGQWRVVPLYAHPTPPPAEGVNRAVRVDKQGVRFGPNCWISHDAITGCDCETEAGRQAFYRDRIIARQYMAWVNAMLAAEGAERGGKGGGRG